MKKFKNLLFDLDGTITDPKEGIINSILYALEKLNIYENNINELDNFIGPPLKNSFKNRYKLSNEQAEKAIQFYREYFSDKGLYENKLYDGMKNVIEQLYNQNLKLFIATSKPTIYAEKILIHFNLDSYFTKIVGSNLDNTRTDKTEIISYLITKYSLDIHDTIMIGDRKHDIIGAKNNEVKSIAITYGYGSLEELNFCKPDFIIHNCKELLNFQE